MFERLYIVEKDVGEGFVASLRFLRCRPCIISCSVYFSRRDSVCLFEAEDQFFDRLKYW